jgi:superkiller protein 3
VDAQFEAWKERAARALDAGDTPPSPEVEELLRLSREAVDRQAQDGEAWYLRGRLLGELRGEDAPALSCLDRALELRPDWFEALVARGRALIRFARYEQAIDDFKRAIEMRPGQAEAHYLRGVALLAMERIEEALDQVERAIGLRVGQTPWWLTKLDIVSKLGDCVRMEDCFAEMAAQLAGNEAAVTEALATYDRLIADLPDESRPLFEKSCLLSHLGRPQEALRCCQQVLEREPQHALAWYVMACLHSERGELDEALAALRAATTHDPRLGTIARQDKRLAALRKRPGFDALVATE